MTRNEPLITDLMKCDIAVVGGGGSGLAAAVAASEKGANVIILEKRNSFGGNTMMAEGLFASESHVQKRIITLNRTLQEDLAKQLRRMNINNAVLFPGLDGFSQSLWRRAGLGLKDKVLLESKELLLYP